MSPPPVRAYTVEIDSTAPGCTQCGAGRMWWIVGPDGVAGSTSYGDEGVAADLAEQLNEAFNQGRRSAP